MDGIRSKELHEATRLVNARLELCERAAEMCGKAGDTETRPCGGPGALINSAICWTSSRGCHCQQIQNRRPAMRRESLLSRFRRWCIRRWYWPKHVRDRIDARPLSEADLRRSVELGERLGWKSK